MAKTMRAAILDSRRKPPRELTVEQIPIPQPEPGHVLLRVRACGICRTDLHIIDGELPALRDRLVPGHQIVGEVAGGATRDLPLGTRVGLSWLGGADGACAYCRRQTENLCDAPTYTGYSVDGGYAEFCTARADFVAPLPAGLDDDDAA